MRLLPLITMGPTEWIIIGVVVLLVLGPTQIPKLVKTFKKTRQEIKEVMREDEEEAKKEEISGGEKA